MRFCFVSTFYPPFHLGGDAVYVKRLVHELADRGHEIEVIHCIDAFRLLSGGKPKASYSQHPNVKIHGLQSPFGFLSPLATQQTGLPLFKRKQIRRVLDREFDVIQYQNISLVGGPEILRYGAGIKLYKLLEYWLLCPMHVLFKYDRRPCEKKSCVLCSLAHRRPPQWWRYTGFLRQMTRHVDAFLSPSLFCRNKHLQLGLAGPIVRLPLFVPLEEQPSGEAQGTDEFPEPFFLFVGRLEKIKGLETLIPVFRNYRRASLLIAGTGRQEKALRGMAGGSRHIQFLGHQSGPRLNRLYRRATALIVPSTCFDIFPNVIIEAFAQKTPAIARNMGGMPEPIQQSSAGFVYDTQEELLAAMDTLLDNPSLRAQLGRGGYQAYLENWTGRAYVERYLDLIEKIRTRGRGGALCGDSRLSRPDEE